MTGMKSLRERLIEASGRLWRARSDHRTTGQEARAAREALDALLEELAGRSPYTDQPGLLDDEDA